MKITTYLTVLTITVATLTFGYMSNSSPTELNAQNNWPQKSLTFDNKKGRITFNHATHVQKPGIDCNACHKNGGFPQKYDDSGSKPGMKLGHKVCKTCHTKVAKSTPGTKAPTKCDGCHKK